MVCARLTTDDGTEVTLQAPYWPLGKITVVWLEGQWAGSFSRVAPPTRQQLRDGRYLHSLSEQEAAIVADCAVLLWAKLEEIDRLIERIAAALLFPVLMPPVRADAISGLAERLGSSTQDVEAAMAVLDFQRRVRVSVRDGELWWACDMPPLMGSGVYVAMLNARAA